MGDVGDVVTYTDYRYSRCRAGLVTRVQWWGPLVQAVAVIGGAPGRRSRGGRSVPAVKVGTRTASHVWWESDQVRSPLSGRVRGARRVGPGLNPGVSVSLSPGTLNGNREASIEVEVGVDVEVMVGGGDVEVEVGVGDAAKC